MKLSTVAFTIAACLLAPAASAQPLEMREVCSLGIHSTPGTKSTRIISSCIDIPAGVDNPLEDVAVTTSDVTLVTEDDMKHASK